LGVSDANGEFQISHDLPSERSVLIVQADRGPVTLVWTQRTAMLPGTTK